MTPIHAHRIRYVAALAVAAVLAALDVHAAPSLAPPHPATAIASTGCSLPPPRRGHTAVFDTQRQRMLMWGGDADDNVWELTDPATATWTRLTVAGTAPSAWYQHAAVYDPVRDRMLILLGSGDAMENDVWELTLSGTPTWNHLSPLGVPPTARVDHSAIYDPVRDRVLVYGGYDGALDGDVWELLLSGTPEWNPLAVAGTPPSPRYAHTAIYDPIQDRMLVFGGYDGTFKNDLWALSLSPVPQWSLVAAAEPPPQARMDHTAVYDPVRKRMVVFAGYGGAVDPNDAWALALDGTPTWSPMSPAGPAPSSRNQHTAVYDPTCDCMIVFGGVYSVSDLWTLDLAGSGAWHQHAPPGTPTWSALTSSGAVPPALGGPGICDASRDRMLIFLGNPGSVAIEVWELTSLSTSPTWAPLVTTGTAPSGRAGFSAVLDPARDRVVIFGGYDVAARNDAWSFSLETSEWSPLGPAGTPPSARWRHAAIYDPVGDRMIVFGGWDGALKNDVWQLAFSGAPSWALLTPSGTPMSPRQGMSAIYDPVRGRMVMFGGDIGGIGGSLQTRAIDLASSAWIPMPSVTFPPQGRTSHSAIYDPVRDQMVIYGGFDETSGPDNVWSLSLSDPHSWCQESPFGTVPPSRFGHAAVYDPALDRMIVHGGDYANSDWALRWGTPSTDVPPMVERRSIELGPAVPNPAVDRVSISFVLPRDGLVSLTLYDLAGRRVSTLARGQFPAGPHHATWDLSTRGGGHAAAGVYYCELRAAGTRLCRRIVVTR